MAPTVLAPAVLAAVLALAGPALAATKPKPAPAPAAAATPAPTPAPAPAPAPTPTFGPKEIIERDLATCQRASEPNASRMRTCELMLDNRSATYDQRIKAGEALLSLLPDPAAQLPVIKQMLEIWPDNSDLLWRQYRALLALDRPRETYPILDTLEANEHQKYAARMGRARAQAWAGEFDASVETVRALRSASPAYTFPRNIYAAMTVQGTDVCCGILASVARDPKEIADFIATESDKRPHELVTVFALLTGNTAVIQQERADLEKDLAKDKIPPSIVRAVFDGLQATAENDWPKAVAAIDRFDAELQKVPDLKTELMGRAEDEQFYAAIRLMASLEAGKVLPGAELIISTMEASLTTGDSLGRSLLGYGRTLLKHASGDRAGALAAASTMIRDATGKDPASPDAAIEVYLYELAARVALAAGAPGDAIRWADRALREDPRCAPCYLAKAQALRARGDVGSVITEAGRAARLEETPEAYRLAAEAHRRTAALDPADPIAHLAQATLEIRKAQKLAPADPAVRAELEAIEAAFRAGGAPAAAPAPAPTPAPTPAPVVVAVAPPPPPPAPVSLLPASVAKERRVALVIANGAYTRVPGLENPAKDAKLVADSLKAAGFDLVQTVSDADRSKFLAALTAFEDEADKADWALVYYAGHGIEVDGTNWLVPVDAGLKSDRSIGDEAVSLNRVLDTVQNARLMRIVILDACRDNPFAQSMKRVATRSVGTRGLARQIEPPGGTLVVYAAKGGQTAQDGAGAANSPFATALAKTMSKPVVEVRKLFGLVRDDVLALTANGQEPHVYGTLGGADYYLNRVEK
ncbi:caspase family protein [Prosthecomicrobium hirschii]|uniref:caspase family protein n=1 Tax=Prosthecodimorpha hirschii TaxID=665126 RepID=UPI00128F7B3A|nr:caspase family protein [Prosthecomicrobium hirschii]